MVEEPEKLVCKDNLRLHGRGWGACHSLRHHAPDITALAGKAAQLHLAVRSKAHIAHCFVLTPHCRCRSRSRPFAVLLLLPLLLLAASLMRPPALLFLLLVEMLLDVTAGICVDDTVYVCLHRRQHCQLCSLPDGIMPLC